MYLLFLRWPKPFVQSKAALMFLRRSWVISNTSTGLKPPIKCKSFLLFPHSWGEKQLNISESSAAPLQQQHLSRAGNGSQNYPIPHAFRCPHSSLLVSTFLTPGWHRDSTGMLAPWPANSRRKEETDHETERWLCSAHLKPTGTYIISPLGHWIMLSQITIKQSLSDHRHFAALVPVHTLCFRKSCDTDREDRVPPFQ